MPHTIPAYKKVLSMLVEIPLERTTSRYSKALDVSLKSLRLKLSTRNTIYSFEDRYTSFAHAFSTLDIGNRILSSVLMLGYGIGSIPIILSKKYGLYPPITAIEIDEEVIRLAEKYTFHENVTLLHQDAYRWVMRHSARFDLICVDVFFDTQVAGKFEKESFLLKLKEMLLPGGILLFNRLTMEKGLKTASENFYYNAFIPVFQDGYIIESAGNIVCVFENK